MNICGEFEKISSQWPTHTAVVYKSERISYAELEKTVQVLKDDLRSIGIEAGHKVGVLFPNGPEHVAATLAIVGIGAVIVFLSPLSSAGEIAALTDEVSLDAICYAERFDVYLSSITGTPSGELELFTAGSL